MKIFLAAIFLALGMGSVANAGAWYGEGPYFRCNPDVAQAVYRGEFSSGYEHFQRYGQFENRVTDGNCNGANGGGGWNPTPPRSGGNGGWHPTPPRNGGNGGLHPTPPRGGGAGWHPGDVPPPWFNENEYLRCYPDVRRAVRNGEFLSGWQHYQLHGYYENRPLSCR